jgi:hypothetical protein
MSINLAEMAGLRRQKRFPFHFYDPIFLTCTMPITHPITTAPIHQKDQALPHTPAHHPVGEPGPAANSTGLADPVKQSQKNRVRKMT